MKFVKTIVAICWKYEISSNQQIKALVSRNKTSNSDFEEQIPSADHLSHMR